MSADTSENGFQPGPILLMGAPGVGKGTQAKLLMSRWSIPQISTGDLLRGHVATGSALGLTAKKLMDAGRLVPDDLVNSMVELRLSEPDTKRGYLLDGYPRTTAQADWLDSFLIFGPLGKISRTKDPVPSTIRLPFESLIAVSLVVPYNQLLRRITGRRICPVCGRIYNIYLQPPARDGFCDVDGTPLERRDDDSESVFEGRMRAYEELTAPVLAHYRELKRLVEINGEAAPVEVAGRVEANIQTLRTNQ